MKRKTLSPEELKKKEEDALRIALELSDHHHALARHTLEVDVPPFIEDMVCPAILVLCVDRFGGAMSMASTIPETDVLDVLETATERYRKKIALSLLPEEEEQESYGGTDD